MRILVLGGGDSPEREVSLRSAANVAAAARTAGYEVLEADPMYEPDILKTLPKDVMVFPILHGAGGEDGTIQKQLEDLNLSFLGSDSKNSAACWDKWRTLQTLQEAGVPVPKGELVDNTSISSNPLFMSPYVLKIIHGGSSIGVMIARRPNEIKQEELDDIFSMESPAILEELIEGIEITISVLDDKSLPVIEIRPPQGDEFDYENKYNGKTAEICPPDSIDETIQSQAKELAEKAHRIMGCRHLSRTDMMVKPNGELAVIDINTIPGLTTQSLYPKSAAAAGLPMPELVKRFVELIQRDYSN